MSAAQDIGQHRLLPWTVGPDPRREGYFGVFDVNGVIVAEYLLREEAAFIARAVNSYGALRAVEARAGLRINSLVNRGAGICHEYVRSEPFPGCERCGYLADVHLVRDLVSALAAAEPAQDTSTGEGA